MKGGFGAVYKAIDLQVPGRFVAIKMPANPRDPEHLRRFRRELGSVSAIDHPHVLKLIEKHPEGQPPFAVFEYLSGGTLREQIKSGPLPFHAALLVLHQIAGALGAIHAKGGFHRDVKPDNIMFGGDGQCVLIDWNLANVPGATSDFTKNVAGTAGYIDPGAVNHSFDALADIYSLGMTVAEASTGASPAVLMPRDQLVLSVQLPAPTPAQSAAFARLLHAMTRKERELRPSATLVQEFSAVLVGGGIYPLLPGETPPRKAAPVAPAADAAGAMFVILLVIGIAVLLSGSTKGGGVAGPAGVPG
jgi:serine/threonine protein kinase